MSVDLQRQQEFERRTRQAVFMLVAAIAEEFGPAVALRVIDGLEERYSKQLARMQYTNYANTSTNVPPPTG